MHAYIHTYIRHLQLQIQLGQPFERRLTISRQFGRGERHPIHPAIQYWTAKSATEVSHQHLIIGRQLLRFGVSTIARRRLFQLQTLVLANSMRKLVPQPIVLRQRVCERLLVVLCVCVYPHQETPILT